ncbi:DUF1491 family protein [Sphingomonas glacialis]|uniref:DUF1491 family protein n=1 Tax=Sphingomonas glacialis TaxID=658225 RepID=A0A502FUB8_9SPHN|nr:DUF1491 family protein [Sphingomonas glacialis]
MGILVSALLKRVNDAGGMAMVRAKGDADSGGILLILQDRNTPTRFVERALGPTGKPALIASGPVDVANSAECDDYWRRRRARDPDLWVIELDIASAERFAAETILGD